MPSNQIVQAIIQFDRFLRFHVEGGAGLGAIVEDAHIGREVSRENGDNVPAVALRDDVVQTWMDQLYWE